MCSRQCFLWTFMIIKVFFVSYDIVVILIYIHCCLNNFWSGHLLEGVHPVLVFPDTVTWISSPSLSLVYLALTWYLTRAQDPTRFKTFGTFHPGQSLQITRKSFLGRWEAEAFAFFHRNNQKRGSPFPWMMMCSETSGLELPQPFCHHEGQVLLPGAVTM